MCLVNIARVFVTFLFRNKCTNITLILGETMHIPRLLLSLCVSCRVLSCMDIFEEQIETEEQIKRNEQFYTKEQRTTTWCEFWRNEMSAEFLGNRMLIVHCQRIHVSCSFFSLFLLIRWCVFRLSVLSRPLIRTYHVYTTTSTTSVRQHTINEL